MSLLKTALLLGSAGAFSALAGAAPPFSSGPPTGMASNRPYYNNCTVCHSSTLVNSGSGSVVLSGVPEVYVPGATYTITVTDTELTARRWGFEMIAQRANGTMGGSFTITDAVNTQIQSSGALDYVMHTDAGSHAGMAGPTSWSVDWTAPQLADGDIAFTVSGNCANNNSFTTGDKIYNNAIMAAAPDGSIADAYLIAQPNLTNPKRGRTWTITGRVRNTLDVPASFDVVTRIRMPNGSYYPPTGWFGGPTALALAANASGFVRFNHPVPMQAPLVTATYEMYLRNPAGGLVYQDSFAFTVAP